MPTAPLPALQVDRRADNPLHRLRDFLDAFPGRALIVAETLGRRETLAQYLAEHGVKADRLRRLRRLPCRDRAADVDGGPARQRFRRRSRWVRSAGWPLAFVTENELYAAQARSRDRREEMNRQVAENYLRDLSELKVGDPVVHMNHGIGRYQGLINMDLGEGMTEFLALEYDDGDKLYVPVSQLQVIGRYSGASPEAAPLHKLGSGQWEKAKRKAAEQVRDTAAELLNIYAQRAARKGYAFQLKPQDYEAFADGFPFEETRDQQAAIDAVIEDLVAGKPMDRLVCGDVGFGKTEVALRAAFVAVADGKQVAVLVPTTLLAEQHFHPFESTAIMCSPKNWPPLSPMLPIWPTTLPSSRLRNQMWLFVRSEMNRNRCCLSGENATPPVEPPTPVLGASDELLDELALLVGDVDAVGVAIGGVHAARRCEKFSVRWPRNSFGIGPFGL